MNRDLRRTLELAGILTESEESQEPIKITIIVDYNPPPIPSNNFDWSAHVDGYEEDGLMQYGRTRQEAIDSLVEYLQDYDSFGCDFTYTVKNGW